MHQSASNKSRPQWVAILLVLLLIGFLLLSWRFVSNADNAAVRDTMKIRATLTAEHSPTVSPNATVTPQ